MRDEMNAQKIQQKNQNNFRGNFLGAADTINESALNGLQAPLPGNGKQTSSLNQINKDVKESELDLSNKAKLLDKIPTKNEELVVSARLAPNGWDEDKETPAVNYRENDNKKEIDNSFFLMMQ